MIVSIATRRTAVKSREEWEQRVQRVLPDIEKILRSHSGFVSCEFRWGYTDDGSVSNVTTWETEEDAKNYIRGGGAATVDWLDQLASPPNPDFRNGPRRFTYGEPSFKLNGS